MLAIDEDNQYFADVKGHMLQKLKDCSEEVNYLVQQAKNLVSTEPRNMDTCLDCLIEAERIARNNVDSQSISLVMLITMEMCFSLQDYENMIKMFVFYVNRRSQLRRCITELTEKCVDYVIQINQNIDMKVKFIETIIKQVSGKVYVEIPRARLVCILSKIKEEQGLYDDAFDLLFELQIDVYDGMHMEEKREIYLEQLRLLIQLKRFSFADAIINRLPPTVFEENFDCSLRYHTMMAHISYHSGDFVEMAVQYRTFYDNNLNKVDSTVLLQALRNVIVLLIMSESSEKQHEEISKITKYKNLEDTAPYDKLLKLFVTDELIDSGTNFSVYREHLHVDLNSTVCSFNQNTEEGLKNWAIFENRIHEYNIFILSKHYSKIYIENAARLLSITPKQVEDYVCGLVRNKIIYARVNQVEKFIDFERYKNDTETLNEWGDKIIDTLKLVNNLSDMIAKEFASVKQ